MLNKRLILTFTLSAALLAGCSTTHYIQIDPTAAIQSEKLTNNRVIQVSTTTNIGNQIGSIKTGLNEHADIFTTNDVKQSVNQSIMNGLRKLGFTLDQGVLPPAKVDVVITKMSYTTKVENLKTIATLNFALNVTVTAGDETYKATFASQKTEEYGTLPYQSAVQKDMNGLASKTVTRLLEDQSIIKLLQQ